jgi:hypothetical protein
LVAVVIIALLLLLLLLLLLAAAAVLAPLWINSERIDKTTIRPSDVQAAATMRMSGCAGLPSQLGPGFPSREGWIQGLVTGRQAG